MQGTSQDSMQNTASPALGRFPSAFTYSVFQVLLLLRQFIQLIILYVTQNHSERCLCDRVMNFLPVTASFTCLMFHSYMSLQIQGNHQLFSQPISLLPLGLLPMGHAVAILVAVCKAIEGKKHLLPCLCKGLRRRQEGNIAMGERPIISSCT